MAITKERKQALVAEYQDLAKRSKGLILTSYSGLTVKDLQALRNQIRDYGGEFHIVKNTLMDLAFKALDIPMPEAATTGTTAIGFAVDEIPAVAKAIVDLGREGRQIVIKGGVIDGTLFDAAQIERLADLPPMPVVQAQLIGVISAPARQAVGLLAASMRQVMGVLQAYSQREGAEAA